jgi:hypothetical protein
LPIGKEELRLPVIIEWRHENGAVGDVRISGAKPRSIAGAALRVTADIADRPDTAAVAALGITVRYEFSSPDGSKQVALTEVTVCGDGRYERQNRWEAVTQPVAA